MKFKSLSRICGLLFSVSLAILAYFCIVVGIALSIDGNNWFGAMVYVFAALAVVNLVALFFTKKKPIVAMIISSISALLVLATTIYLMVLGLITESFVAFAFFAGSFVLGALTSVFAFLTKKNSIQQA